MIARDTRRPWGTRRWYAWTESGHMLGPFRSRARATWALMHHGVA